MFSKIKAFFSRVEQTIEHDVEAIISNFTSTVEKLEAAVVAKGAEYEQHIAAASAATAAAEVARAAQKRAYDVADKIKALVA